MNEHQTWQNCSCLRRTWGSEVRFGIRTLPVTLCMRLEGGHALDDCDLALVLVGGSSANRLLFAKTSREVEP